MEEELLTTLSRLSNVIGGFVTTVLIPVAGYWGYREYNKRKAGAEAKKAEADNITQCRRMERVIRKERATCRRTGYQDRCPL